MAKLTLADVSNIGGNPNSAANVINNNSQLIEEALENTLSRNGSTPNQMLVDIDMDGNDLINVGNVDADDITIDGTSLATQVAAAAQSAQDASDSATEAQGSASDASASASAALDAQVAAEAAEDNITVLIPTINSALQPEDIGVTVQAWNVGLDNISAFSYTLLDEVDAAAWRTALELGSLATLSSINNANWSGTDLAVVNGGTGASDAPTALSNLGGQPLDALLTAIAGLTTAAGGFIRTTGSDTVVAQAIVGTVSQSGGTPTGAIVEQGSGANGNYVRFADGTQICWHQLDTTAAGNTSTATGSLFWQNADTTWTFPAAFSATPVVPQPSGVRTDRVCGGTITGVASTTSVTMRAWAATTLGSSIALRCVAYGRWF